MKKIFLIALILSANLFCGCQNDVKEINSVEDLKNAKIGCWADSGYEIKAREILPDAEYFYFNITSDLVESLLRNKIDAFVLGKEYANELIRQGISVKYLPESLGELELAYIFAKNERGEKICSQMNEFIKKVKSDGELEKLKEKWFLSDEAQRTFTKSKLSGENGEIKIGTDAQSSPFIYLREGETVGFEIELFDKFCLEYGYDYEIKIEIFETMLSEVTLGKLDVGADGIEKLPEREKEMLFSDSTHTIETVAVINSDAAQSKNFLEKIETTLLKENRWQMILQGTATTIFITIFSIIFGTLFGFLIYLAYREKNKIFNKITDAYIKIMHGIPIVVLLMFFSYIVFGNLQIDSKFVAIIVFSLLISVNFFIMLKSSSESISRGQMEAALALGYTERRAFVKFILPQAIKIIFPTYQTTIIDMMMLTSVVGYIAVNDLTRMADLIRARTYDAFIPLVIIGIIYFLLAQILIKITGKLMRKFDSKNREREKILKGLKL